MRPGRIPRSCQVFFSSSVSLRQLHCHGRLHAQQPHISKPSSDPTLLRHHRHRPPRSMLPIHLLAFRQHYGRRVQVAGQFDRGQRQEAHRCPSQRGSLSCGCLSLREVTNRHHGLAPNGPNGRHRQHHLRLVEAHPAETGSGTCEIFHSLFPSEIGAQRALGNS